MTLDTRLKTLKEIQTDTIDRVSHMENQITTCEERIIVNQIRLDIDNNTLKYIGKRIETIEMLTHDSDEQKQD